MLDAFENAGWTATVASPFKLDRTLRETIDDLNATLTDSPIRFRVEERGPSWYLS
jgi:hypothetical protein